MRVFFVILHCSLLDDRGTGYVEMATVGAFLLEVHALRGVACRELARLQDLMEEAAVRTPEQPSLDLADFKVRVLYILLFFSVFSSFSLVFLLLLSRCVGFYRLDRLERDLC